MTISAGSRFGPYELVAPLGSGGMGEVWRARDARLGREVAVKVLPEEVSSDSGRLKRFEKEARAASALNHPNIVTIYDIGSTESVSWIAMERVEGKTLRELLFAGAMPMKRLLSIAAQIADGLAAAHQAGIVHRDLKPENAMVTKEGRVKILDFGLAKRFERSLDATGREQAAAAGHPMAGNDISSLLTETGTSPGVVLGTVGYMSPEQAAGQVLDFRSDQFSLGSILYEMATGKRAFQKATAVDTLSAILHEEPKPLAESAPEAPAPLRWIVERCLAKDPDERYASTRDLARDLAGTRDRVSEASGGTHARGSVRAVAKPQAVRWLIAIAMLSLAAAAGFVVETSRKPAPSSPSFHRIDFRPGAIVNARLTPDGQSVIYTVAGREKEGSERFLYQAWLNNPEVRKLDLPQADILSISSAGEMAIKLVRRRGTLARVPLAGGVPREVVEGITSYTDADWAPGGKSLAIIRGVAGRSRLEHPIGTVLIDSETAICCLRFSRDGREIAFWHFVGEGGALEVTAASGGERRVVTKGWLGWFAAPAWSPDGREVWFNAHRPGEHQAIYAADRAGRTRLVARVPGNLELHDVSRDGRVLANQWTESVTLMGTALGDSKERDLSCLDASNLVEISSDGKKVLIAENGEGGGPTSAAYLRPTDGSPPVRLGDGYPESLSRDGAWVAITIDSEQDTRKPHLVTVPTGAGEARPIPNDTLEKLFKATWMPDGKRLLVSGNEPGRPSRLWIQDVAGGKPRPITTEGIWIWPFGNAVSPDGSLVVANTEAGSMLCPTAGGDPKPIPGWKDGDVAPQWSADGKALFVYRNDESPIRVYRLDLATGQRRLWKEIPQSSGIGRLVISPDGGAYAYWRGEAKTHLYIIDGLR